MKYHTEKSLAKFAAITLVFMLSVSCASQESQNQRFIDGMLSGAKKRAKVHQSNPNSPFKDVKIYQVGRTLGVIFEFTLKDPSLLSKIDGKTIKKRYFASVRRFPEANQKALKTMFDRGLYILYRYKKPDGRLGMEIRIDKNDKW